MHRPQVNRGTKHKPSKGHNMFRAQNRKAQAKRDNLKRAKLAGKPEKKTFTEQMKQQWLRLQRWYRMSRYLRGRHTPHQGPQEKVRRIRQMAEHKCINPECWT